MAGGLPLAGGPSGPVGYDSLADLPGGPLTLPIGVRVADLAPVQLDTSAYTQLLVCGEHRVGKSTLLRTIATAISRRCTPDQARIILIDHRQALWGCVETEHLIGYGAGTEQTRELIASVAGYMQRRLPGPEVTAEQRAARSWWSGPECFVLVDDYDLVAGEDGPLAPLLGYLPRAGEIGLHLVAAGPHDTVAGLGGTVAGPNAASGARPVSAAPVPGHRTHIRTARIVLADSPDCGPPLGYRPAAGPGRSAGPAHPPGRGWLTAGGTEPVLVQFALPTARQTK